MAMDEAQAGRELFWRRLGAGAVDIVLIVALALAASVALYAASGGRLRTSTPWRTVQCQAVRTISAKVLQGVSLPSGARPVAGQVCTRSMAGFETGRYATIALQTQQGEVVRTMAFSRPVDRAGEPVSPVILDWAWPLAFIIVVALLEGLFGTTPGKLALGLRVVGPDGRPLGLARALGRNLVIYGGAAIVLIAPLALTLLGIRLSGLAYYGAVGVCGLLILAPFAMLAEASPRARYDRWVQAEVVRA